MVRTSIVTGSASGIGKSTKELLESRGERVIGVDLHDADVNVDLGTAEGRSSLVDQVGSLTGGAVDAVIAVAGLSLPVPATVSVTYFGMVATLEGLRPFLASSPSPRAVAVSSTASFHPVDDELVAALNANDEAAALERAEILAAQPETTGLFIYRSAKKAINNWVRRTAPTQDWAGASIALNAMAPGMTLTPPTTNFTGTAEARANTLKMLPMPLNGIADPITMARVLAWLGSEENTHICGQIVFVDGGMDAVLRGESVW